MHTARSCSRVLQLLLRCRGRLTCKHVPQQNGRAAAGACFQLFDMSGACRNRRCAEAGSSFTSPAPNKQVPPSGSNALMTIAISIPSPEMLSCRQGNEDHIGNHTTCPRASVSASQEDRHIRNTDPINWGTIASRCILCEAASPVVWCCCWMCGMCRNVLGAGCLDGQWCLSGVECMLPGQRLWLHAHDDGHKLLGDFLSDTVDGLGWNEQGRAVGWCGVLLAVSM